MDIRINLDGSNWSPSIKNIYSNSGSSWTPIKTGWVNIGGSSWQQFYGSTTTTTTTTTTTPPSNTYYYAYSDCDQNGNYAPSPTNGGTVTTIPTGYSADTLKTRYNAVSGITTYEYYSSISSTDALRHVINANCITLNATGATGSTDGTFTISWTISTGSLVDSYRLIVSGANSGNLSPVYDLNLISNTTTSESYTGGNAGATYSFTLYAYDSASNIIKTATGSVVAGTTSSGGGGGGGGGTPSTTSTSTTPSTTSSSTSTSSGGCVYVSYAPGCYYGGIYCNGVFSTCI